MLITRPCGTTCMSVTLEGEGKKNTGLQKQALSKNKAGMEQETSMTEGDITFLSGTPHTLHAGVTLGLTCICFGEIDQK